MAALAAAGISTPFPIQAATLPHTLVGRDLLGRGRTGSGKTYAFAIPLVACLARTPRRSNRPGGPWALVLAPTRELAVQIEAVIAPLARAVSLRMTTVFAAVELHGNLAQNARTRSLRAFAEGTVRKLVATDIAARGLRIDDVELVFDADPPTAAQGVPAPLRPHRPRGRAGIVVTCFEVCNWAIGDDTFLHTGRFIGSWSTRSNRGRSIVATPTALSALP